MLLGVLFASLLGAGCEDFDGIPWRNLYGYLRLLEFDKAKQVLRVHTYPPYLNQYIAQDDADLRRDFSGVNGIGDGVEV